MSVTADQVVVELKPVTAEYDKAIKTSLDTFVGSMKQMSDAASAADKAIAKSGGLNRNQILELQHSARAIFDELAAGQNPVRALTLESGRLAQVLGEGSGGLGGSLKLLSAVANPAVLIIAALGAALAAGVISAAQYASSVADIQKAVHGLAGQLSGATLPQVQAIAEAMNKLGGISIASAEKVEESLISVGHVTSANLADATKVVRDFSQTTGTSLTDVSKLLDKAFADPAKGAKDLGEQFGLLTKKEADEIEKMEEHGDRAGALTRLLRDLRTELDQTNGKLNEHAKGWDAIAAAADRAWQALGRAIATIAGLGSKQDQLKQLEADRNTVVNSARGANYGTQGPDTAALDKQIADLKKSIADEDAQSAATAKRRQAAQNTFPKDKKAKAGPADQTGQFDADANQAIDRAQEEYLKSLLALTSDIQERADLEKQENLSAFQKESDALDAEELKIKKSKNDAHKADQIATLEGARVAAAAALQNKNDLVDQKAITAAIEEELKSRQRIQSLLEQEVGLETQLADSAADRRLAQTQQTRQNRVTEDFNLRKTREAEDVGKNPDQLTKLNAGRSVEDATTARIRALQDEQTRRDTAGPLEKFLDENLKTAAQVREAYEDAAVKGLGAFGDGLTDAITGAKSLKDAFTDVANSIIHDLVRIAIQQAVIRPIAESLFGSTGGSGDYSKLIGTGGLGAAASGGGLFGSAIGNALSSFSGLFATGGFIPPGQWGIAGEAGPEPVFGGVSGATVHPNGSFAQPAAQSSQTSVIQISTPVYADFSGAVVTQDLVDSFNQRINQMGEQAAQSGRGLAVRDLANSRRYSLPG